MRARASGPVADLQDLDVDDVEVTRGAVEAFRRVHGGSSEDAAAGLLDTLEDLVEDGNSVLADGRRVLFADGYRLVLAEDDTLVISYRTVHRQRTLSEVRDGVPSELRGAPLSTSRLAVALADASWTVEVAPSALREARALLGLPDAQARERVLALLRRSASASALERLSGGRHAARGDGLVVTVRADGRRVQTVARDEPTG